MLRRKYSISEITEYVKDLREITALRNHARNSEEATYDNIIKIMQMTLERIAGKV